MLAELPGQQFRRRQPVSCPQSALHPQSAQPAAVDGPAVGAVGPLEDPTLHRTWLVLSSMQGCLHLEWARRHRQRDYRTAAGWADCGCSADCGQLTG